MITPQRSLQLCFGRYISTVYTGRRAEQQNIRHPSLSQHEAPNVRRNGKQTSPGHAARLYVAMSNTKRQECQLFRQVQIKKTPANVLANAKERVKNIGKHTNYSAKVETKHNGERTPIKKNLSENESTTRLPPPPPSLRRGTTLRGDSAGHLTFAFAVPLTDSDKKKNGRKKILLNLASQPVCANHPAGSFSNDRLHEVPVPLWSLPRPRPLHYPVAFRPLRHPPTPPHCRLPTAFNQTLGFLACLLRAYGSLGSRHNSDLLGV